MKNRLYLFSLLLALALAFTACGTEGEVTTIEDPATQPEDVIVDVTGQPVEEADEAVLDPAEEAVDPVEEEVADATANEAVIPPTGAFSVNRISNLYGYNVYNNNNEAIGDIEELVVDMNTSEVKYVVVGVGGFLGIGEKSVAIPYQALTINQPVMADDNTAEVNEILTNIFILDADVETLENAPAIDLALFEAPLDDAVETDAEDSMTFAEQEQAIHTFWQDRMTMTDPAESTEMTTDDQMVEPGMASYVLANNLLEATLVSHNMAMDDEMAADDVTVAGDAAETTTVEEPASAEVFLAEEVGDVEEIIIDPTTGKVRYLLADLNDDLFAGEAQTSAAGGFTEVLTPIPLKALIWNAEEETLAIDTMTYALQDAPTITYEDFETNAVENWDIDLNTYWGEDLLDVNN